VRIGNNHSKIKPRSQAVATIADHTAPQQSADYPVISDCC